MADYFLTTFLCAFAMSINVSVNPLLLEVVQYTPITVMICIPATVLELWPLYCKQRLETNLSPFTLCVWRMAGKDKVHFHPSQRDNLASRNMKPAQSESSGRQLSSKRAFGGIGEVWGAGEGRFVWVAMADKEKLHLQPRQRDNLAPRNIENWHDGKAGESSFPATYHLGIFVRGRRAGQGKRGSSWPSWTFESILVESLAVLGLALACAAEELKTKSVVPALNMFAVF